MNSRTQEPAAPAGKLPDQEFLALLTAMRKEYGELLPAKIAELEHTWDLLLQEWDGETLRRFIRLAHSLAGSAGSYGYASIGEHARDLEHFAKENLGEAPPAPDTASAVSSLVAALHAEGKRAADDVPRPGPLNQEPSH